MIAFYFGVWDANRAGHHLRRPDGSVPQFGDRFDREHAFPWGPTPDGTLCPEPIKSGFQSRQHIEGSAMVHHKDGWSALAFWDTSGDSRPASNSVLMVNAPDMTFDELCELMEKTFPAIWSRLKTRPQLF